MTIAGVVLAGGASTRFGSPKALAVYDGMTLVERSVATLRSTGCEPIVVMAGSLTLPPLAATVLADPGDGPLAALGFAVASLEGHADVLVLACDLPGAGPVVARLAALPAGTAAAAVAPDGRVQPLCSRWPAAGIRRVAADPQSRGRAMTLVNGLNPVLVPADTDELRNVNHPADVPEP